MNPLKASTAPTMAFPSREMILFATPIQSVLQMRLAILRPIWPQSMISIVLMAASKTPFTPSDKVFPALARSSLAKKPLTAVPMATPNFFQLKFVTNV